MAGKILISRLKTFLAFPEWFYLKLPVNTLTEPRSTPGGLTSQFSSVGHYDLGPDQAMIVTVPAAAKDVAPYQGIQLGSMWYISLDYINHQTSLTADQARHDPDGMLRFVISERDPGVANWLECTGHQRGYVQLRWQRLSRDLSRPTVRPSRWSRSPSSGSGSRTTSGRRSAAPGTPSGSLPARLPSLSECSDKGALMLLKDKVVIVSGIGPGLGRSIAMRSAEQGADVVLAARTESRLADVAKEVTALGRRALAVPTDISDPAAAEHLRDATLAEFGRADALVHNALAMPPIKDLSVVDLDAIEGRVRRQRGRGAADDPPVHSRPRRERRLGHDDQLDGGPLLPAHHGPVQGD